jgi:hypothetical protein
MRSQFKNSSSTSSTSNDDIWEIFCKLVWKIFVLVTIKPIILLLRLFRNREQRCYKPKHRTPEIFKKSPNLGPAKRWDSK